MPAPDETQFNKLYCERIKQLREDAGYTRAEMAGFLELKPDTYRRYEGGEGKVRNSPLPPHLIERFATLVGASIDYVLTGKGARKRKIR